jgi:Transposase DDE domain
MRLILTRVLDEEGKVLAEWYLLSNVPAEWADAAKLARCYYWRWRIESYFKLLKSHGFQLEDWLQETGEAIARRILVVTMAAVTVWHLMADDSAPAKEFKQVLVRLSGRQTKRSRPFTAPALLAGLCSLLAMIYTLDKYNVNSLKALINQVNLPIPLINSG